MTLQFYIEDEPPCPTCGGYTLTDFYDAEIGCECIECPRCRRPAERLLPVVLVCEDCVPEVEIAARAQGRDRRGRFTRKEPVL